MEPVGQLAAWPGARVRPPAQRLAIVAACAAAIALLAITPVRVCPLAVMAHVPCPGCGLTRAALALARGHFAEATHLHPLALVIVPLVGAFAAANAIVYLTRGRFVSMERAAQSPWVTGGSVVLVALVLGVWIARFLGCFGGPVAV